jgi:hypothetical protein
MPSCSPMLTKGHDAQSACYGGRGAPYSALKARRGRGEPGIEATRILTHPSGRPRTPKAAGNDLMERDSAP